MLRLVASVTIGGEIAQVAPRQVERSIDGSGEAAHGERRPICVGGDPFGGIDRSVEQLDHLGAVVGLPGKQIDGFREVGRHVEGGGDVSLDLGGERSRLTIEHRPYRIGFREAEIATGETMEPDGPNQVPQTGIGGTGHPWVPRPLGQVDGTQVGHQPAGHIGLEVVDLSQKREDETGLSRDGDPGTRLGPSPEQVSDLDEHFLDEAGGPPNPTLRHAVTQLGQGRLVLLHRRVELALTGHGFPQ